MPEQGALANAASILGQRSDLAGEGMGGYFFGTLVRVTATERAAAELLTHTGHLSHLVAYSATFEELPAVSAVQACLIRTRE